MPTSTRIKRRPPQRLVALTGDERIAKLGDARAAMAQQGFEVSDQRVVIAALDLFIRECEKGQIEVLPFIDERAARHQRNKR